MTHVGVSLNFGLVVMSAIYSVGSVSGVYMNPAVMTDRRLAGRSNLRLSAFHS